MDIATKLEHIVKTVAYNAHLPDQDKLVAWATAKLKEVMAEYVQERKTEEKEVTLFPSFTLAYLTFPFCSHAYCSC